MKIIVDKFPGRAQAHISYLELIRYAAAYHHKAANDKFVSWGKLDIKLWVRIFTVNQAKVLNDHALFHNGPS